MAKKLTAAKLKALLKQLAAQNVVGDPEGSDFSKERAAEVEELRARMAAAEAERIAKAKTAEERAKVINDLLEERERRRTALLMQTSKGAEIRREQTKYYAGGMVVASAGRSKRAVFSDAAQKRVIRQVKQYLEERGIDPKKLVGGADPALSVDNQILEEVLANPRRMFGRLKVKVRSDGSLDFEPKNEAEKKIVKAYEAIQQALASAEVTPRITSRRTGPKKGRVEYSREGGSIALTPMTNAKGETVFALPNLPPIEFSKMYARSPLPRSAFQPTLNDPAVRARIEDEKRKLGPPPADPKEYQKHLSKLSRIARDAQDAVGDLQHKLYKQQYAAARELIKQDPVFFEVITEEDVKARESMPQRSQYDPGVGGYQAYQDALDKWYQSERVRVGAGAAYYVCDKCTSNVRTGHSCSCRLFVKLKLPGKKKFPEFVAPKRKEDESDEAYDRRLFRAKATHEQKREAFAETERSQFMQQLSRMPNEKRLYEQISREIGSKLGRRPSDPLAAKEWDRKKMQLAGEELQARIADMFAATAKTRGQAVGERGMRPRLTRSGEIMRDRSGNIVYEEATIYRTEAGAGAMRGPAMSRELARIAAPGTVTVVAESKAEAERKATDTAAKVVGRVPPKRSGAGPIIEYKKKPGMDGLGASWSEDIGGTAAGIAVGGLVVFALFKALTAPKA